MIFQESVQTRDRTADDGEVNAETDLGAGELRCEPKQYSKRHNQQNSTEAAEHQTHAITTRLPYQDRSTEERRDRERQNEELQEKNCMTDETSIKSKTTPLLDRSGPLPADPRNEESEDTQEHPRVEDFLFELHGPKHAEELLVHCTNHSKKSQECQRKPSVV